MYHVFICYPRTYLDQVTPLHDALELALRNIYRRGAEVFQDTADLQVGNKWEGAVNTALEQARVMVVVVVPTILDSPQCRREMLTFINTPGKHIVPLICEEVPRLRQLAASVDDHPEGSEAHEIAVCARALQTWQAHDFSSAVYQNPTESSYKIAVVELARMIRNKLDFEDQAARASADSEPEPDPPRRRDERTDLETGADVVPVAGGRKSRRGLVGAGVLALLAAGGVGFWTYLTPPEPDDRLDAARAQDILSRALAEAVGQAGAEHLGYDPVSETLSVAAPPTARAQARIPLQPAIDRLLEAGFVPGFATPDRDGDTCFAIDGDPLVLQSSELPEGASASVRLRLFEREEPATQRVCVDATSSWQRLQADSAVVGSGAILAEPRDDARRLSVLRSGQRVQSPFWTSNDVPGWVRVEARGVYGYFPRNLIQKLE